VVLINEYLQNIVGTIESGVVAINRAGHVTIFNRAAEQLTGLGIDAILGRAIAELPAALRQPLAATAEDGQARVLAEVELAKPGGSTLPVLCLTSPLRDPAGGLLGAVAVFSDLTALKQLEMERRRAERLAYFEVLAAGIGHEIKNPLVAIKTFANCCRGSFWTSSSGRSSPVSSGARSGAWSTWPAGYGRSPGPAEVPPRAGLASAHRGRRRAAPAASR